MENTSETAIEARIQDAGATAPRLTPELIDAAIVKEDYHVFPGTSVTVCCLTLKNGYNTLGYSASASLENFREDIGRDIARRNAREKIWSLEGYLLKQRLSETPANFQERVIKERDELKTRLEKLAAFLEEPKPGVSDEAWDLLNQQCSRMQGYLDVLEKRIALF